jgi:transposase
VARAHGLNANQVFKWRRAFERGELTEPYAALLPVAVSSLSGLPGRAVISVESGADRVLIRAILESLRK